MSIFSLVRGGKEHEVFEMRIFGGEVLNSYSVRNNGVVRMRIKAVSFLTGGDSICGEGG